ncbi:metallopeptidase [Saccharomonospora piscinae]|uniref:metallopeptidase n=1 Tax=Saccharomonospora piscinae TaxID=687388 RepID=UPI0011064A77|nr:metallopeptidase [Saccharomonospora piscinae]TLW92277.1 metallopeptidase [Saccharomonospora piscinae]
MTSGQSWNGWTPQHDDFRVTWRGFDRAEVRRRFTELSGALREVTADRDAAAEYVRGQAAELAALRDENAKLRQSLDRVCRAPVSSDGLSERLWRMVDLAQKEAHEVLATAHAEAQQRRAELDVREAELRAREAELEAEHRELVRCLKADAAAEAESAERARREEDERSVRRRQELERDFARNLAVRRDEVNRAIARHEEAAKAAADRIVADAASRADRIVAEATSRVHTLEQARRRAAADLRTAREALAGALPLVEPLPDEVAVDRTGREGVAAVPGHEATTSPPAAGDPGSPADADLPTQRRKVPTVSPAG